MSVPPRTWQVGDQPSERNVSREHVIVGEVHEVAVLPELVAAVAATGADVRNERARNPRQAADRAAARQQREFRADA